MKAFRSAKTKTSGFTIVELLIVIVIIGILAAITIVAYNGVQQRARASAASSALSQAKKKLEMYKVDNSSYPTTGNLAAAGVSNGDVSFQYTSDGTTYCMTGTSVTVSYKVSDTSSPVAGGCPGHGQGGVAAITNYSQNPSAEASLNGLSGPNGSTLSRSSTRAKDGTYSILTTLPLAGGSAVGVNLANNYSVPAQLSPNTAHSYSAWVYVPASTTGVFLSAQGPGAASSNCGSIGTSSTSAKDTWARLSCTVTTSSSGVIALYVLNSTNSTAGMQFYIDSAMFTQGATLYNFADGNSTDWAWNGTANGSSSTGPAL